MCNGCLVSTELYSKKEVKYTNLAMSNIRGQSDKGGSTGRV